MILFVPGVLAGRSKVKEEGEREREREEKEEGRKGMPEEKSFAGGEDKWQRASGERERGRISNWLDGPDCPVIRWIPRPFPWKFLLSDRARVICSNSTRNRTIHKNSINDGTRHRWFIAYHRILCSPRSTPTDLSNWISTRIDSRTVPLELRNCECV